MCGRYTLHTEKEALARRFALEAPELDALGGCKPRYNIAPTQPVLALVLRGGRRSAALFRWGLVPHWTPAQGPLPQWINARSESAATRPAFRDAFASRRCLILASGFYEWQLPRGAGKQKIPHWISRADGEPFAMAGLWARWRPAQGDALESCAILTAAAQGALREIHERVPVILPAAAESPWLSPELDGKLEALTRLLQPLDAAELVARPVSSAVNSVKRDGPELLTRSDAVQLGFPD
jgi:putative SOS response-associated peptidase YedK